MQELMICLFDFVWYVVLQPSQQIKVMSSGASSPVRTAPGQAS